MNEVEIRELLTKLMKDALASGSVMETFGSDWLPPDAPSRLRSQEDRDDYQNLRVSFAVGSRVPPPVIEILNASEIVSLETTVRIVCE